MIPWYSLASACDVESTSWGKSSKNRDGTKFVLWTLTTDPVPAIYWHKCSKFIHTGINALNIIGWVKIEKHGTVTNVQSNFFSQTFSLFWDDFLQSGCRGTWQSLPAWPCWLWSILLAMLLSPTPDTHVKEYQPKFIGRASKFVLQNLSVKGVSPGLRN